MRKRVVRILISMIVAASLGPAAAQQTGGAPPAASPATAGASHANASAAPSKTASTSRDVCTKHPNLKQCS